MPGIELVNGYMEIVFSGRNLERLYDLLSEDLKFRGPLFTFDSAHDYIQSLLYDPPLKFKYEILETQQTDNEVRLIYRFSKPGVSTLMIQYFTIREDKICRIKLEFGPAVFSSESN